MRLQRLWGSEAAAALEGLGGGRGASQDNGSSPAYGQAGLPAGAPAVELVVEITQPLKSPRHPPTHPTHSYL